VDFFVVPTVMFKVLFVFVVLVHDRRRVVHINVTDAPRLSGRPSNSWRRSPGRRPHATSCATAMRSTGSCSRVEPRPWGSTKSRRRLGRLGRIRTWNASSGRCAASAPTTSGADDAHLHRVLRTYLTYYHGCRTHLSLEKDAPEPSPVEHPDQGGIVEILMVGGLHHRYTRQAA
jgi:putative transposase